MSCYWALNVEHVHVVEIASRVFLKLVITCARSLEAIFANTSARAITPKISPVPIPQFLPTLTSGKPPHFLLSSALPSLSSRLPANSRMATNGSHVQARHRVRCITRLAQIHFVDEVRSRCRNNLLLGRIFPCRSSKGYGYKRR